MPFAALSTLEGKADGLPAASAVFLCVGFATAERLSPNGAECLGTRGTGVLGCPGAAPVSASLPGTLLEHAGTLGVRERGLCVRQQDIWSVPVSQQEREVWWHLVGMLLNTLQPQDSSPSAQHEALTGPRCPVALL